MGQRRRFENANGQFQCPDCGLWKDPWEFYSNKRTMTGISTYCKPCHKMRQKKYSPAEVQRRFEEREEQAKADLQEQLEAYKARLEELQHQLDRDKFWDTVDLSGLVHPKEE